MGLQLGKISEIGPASLQINLPSISDLSVHRKLTVRTIMSGGIQVEEWNRRIDSGNKQVLVGGNITIEIRVQY